MNEIRPIDYFLSEIEGLNAAIDMSAKNYQEEIKKLRYKRDEVISKCRFYYLNHADKP
jgi:hypothetical protein